LRVVRANPGRWPGSDVLGETQQISVRVLNQELPAAFFLIPDSVPGNVTVLKERPVCPRECIEQGTDRGHEHLEIDATSQGALELAGFPVAVVLAQHDLRSLQLEIDETVLRPLIRDLEAEDVAPEPPALRQIEDVELRDERCEPACRHSIRWIFHLLLRARARLDQARRKQKPSSQSVPRQARIGAAKATLRQL